MLDKLKADFDAILELVNKTPAALQETAFRMILEHWFSANVTPSALPAPPPPGGGVTPPPSGPAHGSIPDAAKPFLTANGITTETLEMVFHPTGPGAQLVATDIPGTGKAGRMVNLSLLMCVKEALETGLFRCTLKALREMAIHYDCYDSTNFSKTLKANRSYYNPRDKGADLDLSAAGRKKAGDIIKVIASDNAEK